ncbi:heavy metal-associated domain-containing protein [Neolewinella lacunae]|uniref:Heavy-metal-associated domain-containing protein n=1 Tax=Neolewinella lacunae TaxID=1517758 RepID=A0A923PM57_9BACT|nr:heavy metal-associated domain-containing protein [Neolewinella lacunae]MBC6993723.1 heavy-metal-associated domain-containing protein [Neolewinella lacunae]MDN3635749.1 heavy metal-associated domain-containing protein [Neolewinella lacunae]
MRILVFFVALFAFAAMAAPPKKVTIQTNAVCGMCKTAIEKSLNALEGVEMAELDLVTKKVKVKYDADVVNVETLRQAIAATGYDADDVAARPKAREKLAACCKGTECKMPE